MNRDLFNNVSLKSNLVPANRTATSTAAPALYTQGSEAAVVVAHVGASGDTINGSNYIEFEVQESVKGDGSDWLAAPDSALYNPVGTANGATNTGCFALINASGKLSKIYGDGYIGTANYIRIVERRTGTHTNGTVTSSSIVLGNLGYRPASGNAT